VAVAPSTSDVSAVCC